MINQKKGTALAEGIQMMPRLVLIAFIALVVLGGSTILYSHYINIRSAEAMLMTRQVVDCLASKGIIDINDYSGSKKFFQTCGINGGDMNRFFVNVSITNSEGLEVLRLVEGDSGATWIKDFFERSTSKSTQVIKVSQPGTFSGSYNVLFKDGEIGKINVEVFVKDERG